MCSCLRGPGGIGTNRMRVLIADDHSAIRRGIRSILLSREDVDICGESVDGRDVIDRALKSRPDLIILDLSMPNVGGFEAAGVLRRILPEIPILIYSMHDSDQLIQDLKDLGVQGFVSKSQDFDILLRAVDALVIHKSTYFPDTPKSAAVPA